MTKRKRKPLPGWKLRCAAREIIKDEIRQAGCYVAHFEDKQITKAAILMIKTKEGRRMAAARARRIWP